MAYQLTAIIGNQSETIHGDVARLRQWFNEVSLAPRTQKRLLRDLQRGVVMTGYELNGDSLKIYTRHFEVGDVVNVKYSNLESKLTSGPIIMVVRGLYCVDTPHGWVYASEIELLNWNGEVLA